MAVKTLDEALNAGVRETLGALQFQIIALQAENRVLRAENATLKADADAERRVVLSSAAQVAAEGVI